MSSLKFTNLAQQQGNFSAQTMPRVWSRNTVSPPEKKSDLIDRFKICGIDFF